jgi:hypothetical protein
MEAGGIEALICQRSSAQAGGFSGTYEIASAGERWEIAAIWAPGAYFGAPARDDKEEREMAKQQESVLRQIGKETARQTRGFPREFKRQPTGFGDEAGHQRTGGWGRDSETPAPPILSLQQRRGKPRRISSRTSILESSSLSGYHGAGSTPKTETEVHVAMQTARVLRGTVKDEKTIELDEPVRDMRGPVEVTVRPVAPSKKAPLCETLSPEEWQKMLHAWLDSHNPDLPVLPDEALRRESIYEDR